MVYFTDYGKKIISTYVDASDVLVSSMVYVMNDVVDGFQFVLDELSSKDDPISRLITYMQVVLVFLIIMMVIAGIFIPIFAIFYLKTNYSDQHPWAKQMMKGWLVVASVLGIIFTIIFLIFLYANLVTSGICYYTNELLVDDKVFL